jgi:hypothetical protein
MAGYSPRALAEKIGVKPGMRCVLLNAPESFVKELPSDIRKTTESKIQRKNKDIDYIHYFAETEAEVAENLLILRNALTEAGMIWISWPKKSAVKLHKIETDLTEDVIRRHALQNGLVDVKVCAIDDIWSGLKLLIPVKERRKP